MCPYLPAVERILVLGAKRVMKVGRGHFLGGVVQGAEPVCLSEGAVSRDITRST